MYCSMKNLTILIIFLVLALGAISFVIFSNLEVEEKNGQEIFISETEKQLIDAWIIENDLNKYGDIKDMAYIGGTPLFNERTGQSIDRYEYILQRHFDRPWKK